MQCNVIIISLEAKFSHLIVRNHSWDTYINILTNISKVRSKLKVKQSITFLWSNFCQEMPLPTVSIFRSDTIIRDALIARFAFNNLHELLVIQIGWLPVFIHWKQKQSWNVSTFFFCLLSNCLKSTVSNQPTSTLKFSNYKSILSVWFGLMEIYLYHFITKVFLVRRKVWLICLRTQSKLQGGFVTFYLIHFGYHKCTLYWG